MCRQMPKPQPPPKCPPGQTTERGVFDLHGVIPCDCFIAPPRELCDAGDLLPAPRSTASCTAASGTAIILRGEIPAGSRVVVSTYTAEAELATTIRFRIWATRGRRIRPRPRWPKAEWDCLVRSGGGRYLWLQLEFRGNGKVTPRLDSIEIEFPRISLRRYLPAVFGEEPVSADFTDRFLSLFDTTLRSIETKLDQQARYFDPLSTPAERDPQNRRRFSLLAGLMDRPHPRSPLARGADGESSSSTPAVSTICAARAKVCGASCCCFSIWTATTVAATISRAIAASRCRRTARRRSRPNAAGSPPPLILEHFKLRRWLFVGAGRLGDQAVLWGKRIVNRSQLDDTARRIAHSY